MHLEIYRSLLVEASQLRSIRIDADGRFTLKPLSRSDGCSLEVEVDPAFLGADHDCRRFEATTFVMPVPLPAQVVSPLIDPARWSEFSDIEVSAVNKHASKPSGAWSGTIEEKLRWRMLGLDIDYHNRLEIDFDVLADGAAVDFALDESFSGGLDFEEGFFRVEEISSAGLTGLVSRKALRYSSSSDWCRLSVPTLEKILLVWLTAVTAEYAFRMVAGRQDITTDQAAGLALEQLRETRHLFDVAISSAPR